MMRVSVVMVALCMGAVPAAAQQYRHPSQCGDGCMLVSAYYDHGGRTDWACGGNTYGGHPGTDFAPYGGFAAVDEGRPVVAAAAGTVVYSNDGEFDRCTSGSCAGGAGFGNYVQLQHADGKMTFYGHMRQGSVTVGSGASVECGQVLGMIASSGYSTGPHVHFEPRVGRGIDPFAGACGGNGLWVDQGVHNGLPSMACEGPADQPPTGYLDYVGADVITGWAYDPDEPDRALDVHIYIGGPAGAGAGYAVKADRERPDLCAAIGSCNHGYSFTVPRGFLDGNTRPVFAYAIGADNPLLGNAPLDLTAGAPPLPLDPTQGVLRWVQNPDSMTAWHFDWNDVLPLPDAQVNAYTASSPWALAPVLVQGSGQDAVFIREYDIRRHVPSPAAMDAWHFDWAGITQVAPSDVDTLSPGGPLMERPFLLTGSSGAIYVLDAAPPLWAQPVSQQVPANMLPGTVVEAQVVLKNRGSMTWEPGAAVLVSYGDARLCTGECGTLDASTAQGVDGTFRIQLSAAGFTGEVTQCFSLVVSGRRASEPGQGGPAEGALCVTTIIGVAGTSSSSASSVSSVSSSSSSSSAAAGSASSSSTAAAATSSSSSGGVGSSSASEESAEPPSEDSSRGCNSLAVSTRFPLTWLLALCLLRARRR